MSNIYTREKRTINASFPREEHSTIFADDQLSLVYNKFKSQDVARLSDPGILKINFVFAHGTGMNKSIWDYYVEKLYQHSKTSSTISNQKWVLDSILTIDAVTHGDSAVLNSDLLGWSYDWRDGAKDIIKAVKHEQNESKDFKVAHNVKNIMVGHSMGGYQALYAGFLESSLFDAVIAIEPVIYGDVSSGNRFQRLLPSLKRIIQSNFASEVEYEKFFKKFSFYKNFDPTILKSFMTDELQTKSGKVTLKSSKEQQLIAYACATSSIPVGMAILPFIRSRVLHIVGANATWNPSEAIGFIRSSIPNCKGVDIERGEHLVNCEQPDVVLNEIKIFIGERVRHFRDSPIERGSRKEIFDRHYGEIISGKFGSTINAKL